MSKLPMVVAALGALFIVSPAWCQGGAAQINRFERRAQELRRQTLLGVNEALSVEQRALLEYGGFVGFNFYAIDDQNQNTHFLRQTQATAYASLNLDNAHRFFIRGLTIYDDFNTGDSFDDRGDDFAHPTLDRATWSFDLSHARAAAGDEPGAWNLNITAGRQLAHWVSGLTLDRALDGVSLTLSDERLTLHALAGVTIEDSFDFDSSRPNFDDDTRRFFAGGMASYQLGASHRPFIYGLVQNDRNADDFLLQPLGPSYGDIPTFYNYDSHYLAAGSTGNLGDQILYSLEAVYQGGETLSHSFIVDEDDKIIATQTNDNIEAWALDAQIFYLVNDANHSRIELEVLLASGDTDRGHTSNTFDGNAPNTTDRAFNAFGLIDTGLAFAPIVSNLVMLRGGLSTFPLPNNPLFKRLQVGTNLFVYHKFESQAPIDEQTANDAYLGSEADLFANWQITSDVSLALRYGVFFPGDAILGDNQARHFLFTGVTYAF